MSRIKNILSSFFHQKNYIRIKLLQIFASCFSDAVYLKLMFPLRTGYKLNLNSPKSFNEKLQWLKLYNRRPEYTQMVDKVEAKKYVAEIIGEDYIIPTLAVYDKVKDVDFESLPSQFVLKCSHDSGGLVICHDKNKFNRETAKEILMKALRKNYYMVKREWPYKNVKHRIIAEQYMEDESGELRDYKFFCFNGKVRFFKIDFGRYVEHHANYYDTKGNLLPFGEASCPPLPEKDLKIPGNLNRMIELAERLSKNIPFLRVDFYDVRSKIYFGELTLFPASGMGRFTTDEWDMEIGNNLVLPDIKIS